MANDKMLKMLMSKKKEGKILSDSEKKAKLHALSGMRDMASQMMGDKLKGLKKVTVASNSKPGLKEGLHKAESLLDKSPEEISNMNKGGEAAQMPEEFDKDEESMAHEAKESPEFEAGEDEEAREGSGMSPADAEGAAHEEKESPEFEAGEQEESLEKILSDSPNDPDQLEELIRKLEEKKQQLSK